MAAAVLFVSSLSALLLLVFHSWRRRGGTVTAAFFLPGIVFGIVRGNLLHIMSRLVASGGQGHKPYLPQGGFLPDIGHASVQVTIGWLFAGYLAWTLSEYVLRRLKGWENRLFPTVALAALFMSCMSYCMESTATRIGWWYWDISTVDAIYGHVPAAGIMAWFSIATDLLFPVLLIACSEYRHRWWRWLTLLVFPVHMAAHAIWLRVPFVEHVHVAMILATFALAFFSRVRVETGMMGVRSGASAGRPARWVDLIPAVSVVLFLGILLQGHLRVVGDFTLTFTVIPLVVFLLLSVVRLPIAWVLSASAAGLAAAPWVGVRAAFSFAPVALYACFHVLHRARRKRAVAWGCLTVILAGLTVFVVNEERRRFTALRYWRLLRQARQEQRDGHVDLARRLRDEALRIEFTDPVGYWFTIRELVMLHLDDLEPVIPEVKRRHRVLARMDPEWVRPYFDWTVWLLVDGELDEAVGQWRRVVDGQPRVSSHRVMLAYLLLRRAETTEAERELKVAAGLEPLDAEARVNLAVIAASRGDDARARELLDRVLAENPEHVVARLDREHLLHARHRFRIDLTHMAAPRCLEPAGVVLSERAIARAKAGDLKTARNMITEAAHYTPLSPTIRGRYGLILERGGGSLEEAIEQYEQVLRLDAGRLPARRSLTKLSLRLARQQIARDEKAAARETLTRALPRAADEGRDELLQLLRELEDPQR